MQHSDPVPSNKSEAAYDRLEELITFRDLAPGTMVSEGELMRLLGMGRTPIREALQRLSWERMVEIHPRRGVVIPPVSVEVQLKLLELRRSVEETAVVMAAHRAEVQQKKRMLELAYGLESDLGDDVRAYGQRLKQVHRSIVEAAHNEYLSLALGPLHGLSRRFWFATMRNVRGELRGAASRHAATLRAICHGDEKAAAAASVALNDYLIDFAYRSIRPAGTGGT